MRRPVRATEDQGSTKWIEAELPYRSVWLPIRIVGEQTAIGEADVVDEEQPKSKTDQARCDCELPVEPWQIDRGENERSC